MDEAAAVARARAGDSEAFRLLVEGHSRALYRLAYRMTGNAHDAEDVVQEAFLKAFRRLDRFDQRSHIGSWLYRIAANCAFDLLRARQRHDRHFESSDEEFSPERPASEPGPERMAMGRDEPAGTTITGLTYVGSGTGRGSHLGNSTWTSTECGDPATGLFRHGLLVITAANGDTLNVEFSGTFTTDTWPFPAAEFDVIAGGTGRFADARGSGTSQLKLFVSFDAEGNPISPWPITLSGAGQISY